MDEEQQIYVSNLADEKDYIPAPPRCNNNHYKHISRKRTKKNINEIATFVKDISSGTMYGEGFKNGARSMYISKSSELRCISSIDIPLLEAGFTNSLRVCLEYREIHQNIL